MKKCILTAMCVIFFNHNFVLAKSFCKEFGNPFFPKNPISAQLVISVSTGFFMGYNYGKKTKIKIIDDQIKDYIFQSCEVNPDISLKKILKTAADTNFSLSFVDKFKKNNLKKIKILLSTNKGVMKTCHIADGIRLIFKGGKIIGGAVYRILERYSKSTGLTIRYFGQEKFDSCLDGMKSGKYDVVTLASKKPERTKYMDYYFAKGNTEDSIAISKKSSFSKFKEELQKSVDMGL